MALSTFKLFFIGEGHSAYKKYNVESSTEDDQHGEYVIDHNMKKKHPVNENKGQEQQHIIHPNGPHQ
jgi:hypothetical protein